MISRDLFRTGDDDLVPIVTAKMQVPDNVWIWRALQGALLLLCDRDNWEQVGTASIDLAEQTFVDLCASIDFVPDLQYMFYDLVPQDPDVTVINSFGVSGQYLRVRDFTIALKLELPIKGVELKYTESTSTNVTQVQITAGTNVGNMNIAASNGTVTTQLLEFDTPAMTDEVSMIATAGNPSVGGSNLRLQTIRLLVAL